MKEKTGNTLRTIAIAFFVAGIINLLLLHKILFLPLMVVGFIIGACRDHWLGLKNDRNISILAAFMLLMLFISDFTQGWVSGALIYFSIFIWLGIFALTMIEKKREKKL